MQASVQSCMLAFVWACGQHECTDMFVDVCRHVGRNVRSHVQRHVQRHVRRHVHRHVQRHVRRHVHRHVQARGAGVRLGMVNRKAYGQA